MNFKDTIFLPSTDFQMRGNLVAKEPVILKQWNDLYSQLRIKNKNCKKFIVHDGPPFANGHLHIGHALNKILKDIIVRMHQMRGYDAPLQPGWDCHGLPIEWAVERKLKEKKIKREDLSIVEFRKMCRDFASHWIEIQKEEFQRLGVCADWDNPYLTMSPHAEATVIRLFGKFIVDGSLYRGEKPVLWSVIEKTALADAEVEYQDVKSTTIFVAFPIIETQCDFLRDAYSVIWTTTPWTIPGNRAICFSNDIEYCLLQVGDKRMIVAEKLVEDFSHKIEHEVTILKIFHGELLKGTICRHPLHQYGYGFSVPMIHGDHVTTDSGTGLVHTAPGHGIEDFIACKNVGIEVPLTVNESGVYYDCVPLFAGQHIFKVEPEILKYLTEVGALIGQYSVEHSYPHSWRSKAPLIYRTTPQWFISMDKNGLRSTALQQIDKTKWIPKQGYNRIRAFVENRGDWCVSRQRVWGVPLPIFINKKTGEPIRDQEFIDRIADIFEKHGADAWFAMSDQELLGDKYNAADYEKNNDTLDVWFESSSSYAYTIRANGTKTQADLYIEGSDQHRGWFQHSLLNCCEAFGEAPFKSVLTHGFIVDEQGRKMSKSLGNGVSLQEVVNQSGADVLRMWVSSSDFTQDLKIGKNIVKQLEDIYRKLRNTIRYMLGALSGYKYEPISYSDLPLLEKWILHRVSQMYRDLQNCVDRYDVNQYFTLIHTFCAVDLSSFYFDIRKDCLYCDSFQDAKRKAYQYVINILFHYVIKWLAPILVFTTDEAWQSAGLSSSVHLQNLEIPNQQWHNAQIGAFIDKVRNIRKIAAVELEKARKDKSIGSSLQACVTIFDPQNILPTEIDIEEWKDILIVSDLIIKNESIPADIHTQDGIGIYVSVAEGEKCERCWKIFKQLNENKVCDRCQTVLNEIQ